MDLIIHPTQQKRMYYSGIKNNPKSCSIISDPIYSNNNSFYMKTFDFLDLENASTFQNIDLSMKIFG